MRGRRGVAALLAPWLVVLAAALAALLAGCAAPGGSTLQIDDSFHSKASDSRVQHIVLHYTNGDFATSLKVLTQGSVSAHYLVRRDPPRIYRLLPEDRRAWHAGVGSWEGRSNLNSSSIGIEIDNAGPLGSGRYEAYPEAQMQLVVALVADIARRHGVRPHRIIGHSDMSPTRKRDPGPAFPWQRLVEAGLIPWPDAERVAAARARFEAEARAPGGMLPMVQWYQDRLAQAGYEVPRHGQLDDDTRDALAALQMKYRPRLYDGQPDAETAALLQVLTAPAGLWLTGANGQRTPYLK